ncbi:hypothetical protein BGX21_008594, partial [Mortierella sp. AD011]
SVQAGQKRPRDSSNNKDAGSSVPSTLFKRPQQNNDCAGNKGESLPPEQTSPFNGLCLGTSTMSSPSIESAFDTGDVRPSLPVLTPNGGERRKRVSFGRCLTLEDFSPVHEPTTVVDDRGSSNANTTPPACSPRYFVDADLPSDPANLSFVDQESLNRSISRLYDYNYLDGPGRIDSNVDNHWVCNGVEVGGNLMAFRDRVIENNGGLIEPHQKLDSKLDPSTRDPIRIEGQIQLKANPDPTDPCSTRGSFSTRGFDPAEPSDRIRIEVKSGQIRPAKISVEDRVWDSLCDATKDLVPSLASEEILEDHQWAHHLAQSKPEEFARLLEESPPRNPTLKSILIKIAGTAQLWNAQRRNEDTYLKSQLGPFLDTYFGKLKYTKSDWTPVQGDTRGQDLSLLISDYGTTTQVGRRQLFVVMLEGKITGNVGSSQEWDDLTKVGQEMKLALDSILKLEPEDEVCVVGLLVREHAKAKVEHTVAQIRQVKIRPSPNPKVPLAWLRPSFKKPKLRQIIDGQ